MGTGARADRLIVDDPHAVADADSPAKLESALLWWRERRTVATALAGLAVALALAGLLLPGRLGPVHRIWMGFAHALSRVTTPIFMGVVYFLVITPVGLVRRAVGGNPLRAQHGSSGWVDRQSTPRGDLTRQF